MADIEFVQIVAVIARWIAARGRLHPAKRTGTEIWFLVSLHTRLILWSGIPLLFYVANIVLDEPGPPWLWLVTSAASVVLTQPKGIRIDAAGIVQRSRLGVQNRVIVWTGAAAAKRPESNGVMVIGSDGTTITHTQYHVGQADFINELRRHNIYIQGDGTN